MTRDKLRTSRLQGDKSDGTIFLSLCRRTTGYRVDGHRRGPDETVSAHESFGLRRQPGHRSMASVCYARAVRAQRHHQGWTHQVRVPRWDDNSLPFRGQSRAHLSCPVPNFWGPAASQPRASWSFVGPNDNTFALDHFLSCIRLGLLRARRPSRYETRTFTDDLSSGLRWWIRNRFEYCHTALERVEARRKMEESNLSGQLPNRRLQTDAFDTS